MDRRTLVLGGGVAALALAAGPIGPATAATDATADHVRRVVGLLDVGRGLGDLDAARARVAQCLADLHASAPRDPRADDLYAWLQRRVTDLTGRTDPFENVAGTQEPTRTMIAFAFAAQTQLPAGQRPVLTAGMRTPATLRRLEPDFFPELAAQLEQMSARSPAFAALLAAGAAALDRLVADLTASDGGPAELPRNQSLAEVILCLALIAVIVLVPFKGDEPTT